MSGRIIEKLRKVITREHSTFLGLVITQKKCEHNIGLIKNNFQKNFDKPQPRFKRFYSDKKADGVGIIQSLVSRISNHIIKSRYILAGTAVVASGLFFIKWKNFFPDFTYLRDKVPNYDSFIFYFKRVASIKDGFQMLSIGQIENEIKQLQNQLYKTHNEYKEKLRLLEEENKNLRKELLHPNGQNHFKKKIHKSLIDMYSEVVDDLCDYDKKFKTQDIFPKVLIVGDQNAGKKSVLEMIIQAPIFPRNATKSFLKTPVQVTISEGPYQIAHFKGDVQEYDLTQEKDLENFRDQMEFQMKNCFSHSDEGILNNARPVSIIVEGPRLPSMVLINVPTMKPINYLDNNSKEFIEKWAKQYLSNNSIILCIQDASTEGNSFKTADLLSRVDSLRKRTVFVQNKIDLIKKMSPDPMKMENILFGKSDSPKALSSYAVISSRGKKTDSIKDIRQYEEDFFKNLRLPEMGSIKNQLTTQNLIRAVAGHFWSLVKDSMEKQADIFKASYFNLKTEWKNSYPGSRELDRDELFEKARREILDEIVSLRGITVKQWEEVLIQKIWERVSQYVFENIYLPSSQYNDISMFNTSIDIKLREWANRSLPNDSVEAGWEILKDRFSQFLLKDRQTKNHDDVFDLLKDSVLQDVVNQHVWETKSNDVLRVIQLNALEDSSIQEESQWNSAVKFLENYLNIKLKEVSEEIQSSLGPGFIERWLHWKYPNEDHIKNCAIKSQLETNMNFNHSEFIKTEEPEIILKDLQENGMDVDLNDIVKMWKAINHKIFLINRLKVVNSCRGSYRDYIRNKEVKHRDVILFWRIQQMLKGTANTLRQQIMNKEIQHLGKEVDEILEAYNRNSLKKHTLLTGRRVDLAEEIKRVRKIYVKLEAFIQALNRENKERALFNNWS